jgi:tellurite resistance protein TerC
MSLPQAQSGESVPIASSITKEHFVDLQVSGWAWVGLLVLLLTLLAVDLVRHREAHAPTNRQALGETLLWVTCGLSFSVVILVAFGPGAFGEYLSGYVIEKALSVDNVFVWSLLFTTMAVPLKYQHRVLFWGIFGALGLRAIFIFAGTALIGRFWWLMIVFGVFLVWTGWKILRQGEEGEVEDAKTPGLTLLKRFIPVSDVYDGQKFFTIRNGVRFASPLLAALVVIELSDVIFAVDSVPAILAVSHEPFIVFSSNAFAILGLRAMYFLLANAKDRFEYLSDALGVILIFVGVKMVLVRSVHISTPLSLAVIVVVLSVGMYASVRNGKPLLEAKDDSKVS